MRIFLITLLIIVSTWEVWATHPKNDTVVLYHNEMITGEIKELRLGELTIDTKNLNIISIKVSKIQSINTATDTFRIETIDQMLYYGVLKPAPKEGHVYIVSSNYVRLIAIDHINAMLPAQESFIYRLQGNISAGFTYTHSSGIGQLSTSANIYYTAKRMDLAFAGSSNSSIDTSTFSRDRADVSLSSYYNLQQNSKFYAVGQLDYQRNLQLSVARRFQQTIGGGRKFILGTNIQLMGMLGFSLDQELSTSGENELLMEIPLGLLLNYFKFASPNLQATSKNAFYTSLSQKGRIRYEMNTNISWELIDNFYITWTFYISYDRKPPDPDAGKMDYGTTISLTYKF